MTPKKDKEKSQKQRFIETARELGCDETGEKFDEAFRKIVPPKEPTPALKDK